MADEEKEQVGYFPPESPVSIEVVEEERAAENKSPVDLEIEIDLTEPQKDGLDDKKADEADPPPPKSILKKPTVTLGEEYHEESQDDDGKKKTHQKPKRKLVPIWRLFRYADCFDVVMIILGVFLAAAAGIALPSHMLLFGRVINEFVTYSIALSTGLSDTFRNMTNCTVEAVTSSPAYITYVNSTRSHFCVTDNSTTMASAPDIVSYACFSDDKLRENIGLLSLYYVAIATGVLIALFFATIFWNLSAYRQTRRMRLAFYSSILRQEIGWFDVTEAAQLNTRLVDDIEKIQAGIGDKLALFLQYLTTFVTGFVIAYSINWKLALVLSIMLPLLTAMAFLIARIIVSYTVKEQSAYAAAGAVAEEVLSSIRTVVAFGGEAKEAERYGEQLVKARNVGLKKAFLSSLITGMLFFLIFGTYALGFGFGSELILNCELTAGDIVTVLFSIIIGSFNLGNALPEIQTIATAIGAATVVYEIIDREPQIDSSSDEGVVPEDFQGNIELEDVIFHYPARPDIQILHGLDLTICKGQTVALVGPSGCGKSTVIQLIQRLYDRDAGLITIDGNDIKTLNLRWLRKHIGIVSQEPSLFNTTIAENIRYGKKDATMDEIIEAAKNANAHNFISELPDGYDTHVGERGAQLSGGQKQRIAIARAIVKDPKVLLLDEATSALDTESEKVVQDALDKAREGRTTIVIAHRLSTIQTADIIVSIEDGRVVEKGTHAELMDKEGLYYELVTAQTIIEEEDEPLADFKAAVKHTMRQDSTSDGRPSLSRGFSQMEGRPSLRRGHSQTEGRPSLTRGLSQTDRRSLSRDPQDLENQVSGLSDFLSKFSTEDLPIGAAPSPRPGRVTFPGQDEFHSPEIDDYDDDMEEEGKVVKFQGSGVMVEESDKVAHHKEVPKVSFLELLKLNIPDWPLVLTGVIGSAIMGALFPLLAILFGGLLAVFGLSDPEEIRAQTLPLVGGYLALAVGSSLVQFTASFTLSVAGERLTKRLRYLSFQAMVRQEIAWFDKKSNSTGALTTRLANDASEVKGATGIRLGVLLQQIFGLVVALIVAFTASWELTFILMLCFPVLVAVGFFQIRLIAGKAQKNKKGLENAGQIAVESIDNIRTVVSLSVEPRFYESYQEQIKIPFKNNIKGTFLQALVAFAAVVFTALSVGRASSFAPDASKAQHSASRVLALLRRKPNIDATSTEGQKPETASGAIEIKNVHFNYPERPEVNVLQGLSVSVKPGQTLALVGPSGCGKSTSVSLVERFYDPHTGNLTMDGTDLQDLNLKWLRSKIGIVSQEPSLFDATIAENIRYGALFREVSDEEVVEAAKSANIHSFIETLPMGYNTNVGAKGTQLSGGQKQRIAIARALVRDPKVLLLDEATSALDTESEKVVQDALDKAREGRTSIVIAHRLSTIFNSDVIAVIHKGQVIESGTHSELMAKGGAYYHLNTVQLEDFD